MAFSLSDDTKERIVRILDTTKLAIHYGWIPFIIYLGWSQSVPRPGLMKTTPKFIHPHEFVKMSVDGRRSRTNEIIAGLSAGAVSTLVMHPLDLIKIRLQVNEPHPWRLSGISDAYRGLGVNLAGNTISWGLYFMLYNEIKASIGDGSWYLASAFASGTLTSFATTPIWMLKTRILATRHLDAGAYRSVWQGAKQILQSEGPLAFWKGVLPGMFGTVQAAIQFSLYEQFKNKLREVYGGGGNDGVLNRSINGFDSSINNPNIPPNNSYSLNSKDFILLSALSKIIATTLMYPYQVIRSRTQIDKSSSYTSMRALSKSIWRSQGIWGFYKGLLPNLIRVVPATSLTFGVYEGLNGYLG